MKGRSPSLPNAIDALHLAGFTMRGRSRLASASIATGVALGLVVSLTVLSGTWNPLEHTACLDSNLVAQEAHRWDPAILINSPYGGSANGTAHSLVPSPAGEFLGIGTSTANGTTGGIFVESSNASLFQLRNATVSGLGSNDLCRATYSVSLHSDIYGSGGVQIPTISNLTDAGEATNLSVDDLSSNLFYVSYFDNGFSVANAPNITTCGEGGMALPVQSAYLTIGIPFNFDGRNLTMSYVLPYVQDFVYHFPPSFGTWAVDNLSALGGPGGGWAFDYLGPCA